MSGKKPRSKGKPSKGKPSKSKPPKSNTPQRPRPKAGATQQGGIAPAHPRPELMQPRGFGTNSAGSGKQVHVSPEEMGEFPWLQNLHNDGMYA